MKLKLGAKQDLTEGSVVIGLLKFAIPLFLGQLLQQLYNVADAWVVGNFANNEAFAAVSSTGSMVFLIIGFFSGMSIGGGVIISRYFGAKDEERVRQAVHSNMILGIVSSVCATVIAQGVSAFLCIRRLMKMEGPGRLCREYMHYYPSIMKEVIVQGLPTGIQNSVISIGNIVVQSNINTFGQYAMSGAGAYSKIEGFVFLPITSMSMSLPTFIGQNLGAKKYDRAKKGAAFGIISGVVLAELFGILMHYTIPDMIRFFVKSEEAIPFGVTQASITSLFFCLLAYSHCAAGVLRGCGKSIVPMVTMLTFWCGLRIVYVTAALHFINEFRMIAWAYPLTWSCSTIVFTLFLIFSDWTHAFEKKRA